ncbi:MAG: hypothetical protein AB8F94_10690 [Saprospiraceae bacterium]
MGLFLGLGLAFSLLAFFSFSKLAIHHLTYMSWMGYAMHSPSETRFYQVIFAFIALLMGQYFFLEFTLSKPKEFLKRNIRKKTILHNSRFSSWTILFVGFKWALSIGLLSMSNVFSIFSCDGIGWWLSLLLVVWWHFFTWQEISRTFTNGRMLSVFAFFGIAILSIIFTRFIPNIYASSYRQKAKQTPQYQLKIDVPLSQNNVSTKLIHPSLIQTFFVGDPEENDSIKISTFWGNETEMTSLPLDIENFNHRVPESKKPLIIASLVIDKEIQMKHVLKLLKILSTNNRLKISFATIPADDYNPNLYFEFFGRGLLAHINFHCNDLRLAVEMINKSPKTTVQDLMNFYAKNEKTNCKYSFWKSEKYYQADFDFIKLTSQNEYFFNGKKIAREEIFEKTKDIILEKNTKANFIFDVDEDTYYEHYFFLRHEHKRAMNEVRNQEARIRFGKNYEFLEKIQQREIRAKYPLMIWEFYSDEERFIFDFFRNKK